MRVLRWVGEDSVGHNSAGVQRPNNYVTHNTAGEQQPNNAVGHNSAGVQ